MEVNLIGEAFKFMLLGMGIVFMFLIIMVFALKLQAFLIAKFFPAKEETKANEWKPTATANTKIDDKTKVIAAITAAIQHHTNNKG
ncbi:MAG: OadG family protein [Campylobacterota bacterium]|nr:OadG family protein [Campylobacterota bacterium]